MHTSPASEVQLSEVQRALDEFRAHWQSFKAMPQLGGFTGTLEDVHALDYLDYEGLGYPTSGISGASLVWGKVLACQLEISWVTDSDGHLLLKHDVPGSRITVWPYARVLEVQERSLPQFEKYAWILEAVVRDYLEYGEFNEVSPLLLTFGPHPLHKIPQFRPALGHPPESPHALAHRPIVATGHLADPLHPSPTQVPRRHSHHPIPPPVSMSPAHLFPASPQACTSVPNRSGSSDTHPINRGRSSSRRNTVSTPVARLMTGYQPSETGMRRGRAMRPESATTPICH